MSRVRIPSPAFRSGPEGFASRPSTRSGLSAFAARSQRRGSANRNGDPDFEELSSNPFARFVCNAPEFSMEPRTYAPNPRVLRGAAPNESLYFGTDFERFACANSIFFVHLLRKKYDTNETCNDEWYRKNKAMHSWTRLRLFVQLINTVRQ